MSRLVRPKSLIIELTVNEGRSTVDLIGKIAKALKVAVGEHEQYEYVQLRNIKHMQTEMMNATQPMEH